MPQLPTPATIEERDAQIMKYLEHALDYMRTGDAAKGPVAKMYADFIIETFEATEDRP